MARPALKGSLLALHQRVLGLEPRALRCPLRLRCARWLGRCLRLLLLLLHHFVGTKTCGKHLLLARTSDYHHLLLRWRTSSVRRYDLLLHNRLLHAAGLKLLLLRLLLLYHLWCAVGSNRLLYYLLLLRMLLLLLLLLWLLLLQLYALVEAKRPSRTEATTHASVTVGMSYSSPASVISFSS
uniref:Uncharacterized protein n=1 Tax=Anopheles melas TaxID=34690 RepID=A0A182TVZ4_9DIPT